MKIVEVEGTLIEPIEVDQLEISSGQRYSVLLKADQPINNYFMQQTGKWRAGGPENGFSVLKYKGASDQLPIPTLKSSSSEHAGWITSQFKPVNRQNIPLSMKTLVLHGKQIKYNSNGTGRKWALNNISYVIPEVNPILYYAQRNELKSLPMESRPFHLNYNDVVDIIFQNYVSLNGICEVHPWHIHGHSFWVIAQGTGGYGSNNTRTMMFSNPILRDTVTLYATNAAYFQPLGTPNEPCGWIQVRFVANNPGAWALHCHIISHFALGMATSFVVGSAEQIQNALGYADINLASAATTFYISSILCLCLFISGTI